MILRWGLYPSLPLEIVLSWHGPAASATTDRTEGAPTPGLDSRCNGPLYDGPL